MLDVRPGNWIPKGEELYFVDVYPPLLQDSEGLVTPWIESLYPRSRRLYSFSFGDIRGQITRLLFEILITMPGLYPNVKNRSLEIIENCLPLSTYNYIFKQINADFPDMRLFYFNSNESEGRLEELLSLN